MSGFEGLLVLGIKISVGLAVIFGVRIATSYFLGDIKGGKSDEGFKIRGR